MADFLASFNFREQTPGQTGVPACASLEEVQSRLRDLFNAKVTPTRAEHVESTLELAASAQVMLEKDKENEGLEALGNIDPVLGGLGAISAATEQSEGGLRAVTVSDALTNQPSDNPVLQRSVAKAIINGLGALDGSEWTVTKLSRGSSGWTFGYACKGSVNQWTRQNKSQIKAVIADCSKGEMDPQLAGRPAFDCRGSVTLSFSRETRTISIRYNHTPLHKTVAELAAFFAPPPPPPPPVQPAEPASEKRKTPKRPRSEKKERSADKPPKTPKTPKTPKAPKPPKEPKPPKAPKEPKPRKAPKVPKEPKEPGTAKKRRKKTGDGLPSQAIDSAVDPSAAGASQAPVEEPSATDDANPAAALVLNLTPEEAERRRDAAAVMLSEAGVEPDTLSAEQFNIFANQSPDLQKESLSMLVKYGAERLRIVHPGNREESATASPTSASNAPAAAGSVQSASGPTTTGELALQTKGHGNSKSGKKRRAPTKSRIACIPCKRRKVKCPREMPACTECQTSEMVCEYPPLKPKKAKSSAMVAAEDLEADNIDETEMDVAVEEEEENPDQQVDEEYSELPDSSAQPQMPVSDMLTTDMSTTNWGDDETENHYYQATANLTGPASASQQAEPIHDQASSLLLNQGQMYYPSHVPSAKIQEQQVAETISPAAVATVAQRRQPLPDGIGVQAQRNAHHSPLASHAATTSDWHTMSNLVTQAATASGMASTMPSQPSADDGFGRDRQGVWRGGTLAQTAMSQDVMDNAQQASRASGQQQQQQQMGLAFNRHGAASPMTEGSRKTPRMGTRGSQARVNDSRMETLQTAAVTDQHGSSHGSLHQGQANLSSSSTNYNSYDRYPDNRGVTDAPSNGRITYEPYSYQRNNHSASSYPSYNQSTHTGAHVTTAAAMPSTTATAMAAPLDQSDSRRYGQFSQGQGRSHAQGQNQNQSRNQSHSHSQGQSQSQSQSHGRSSLHSASHGTSNTTGSGYNTRTQNTSANNSYGESRSDFDLRTSGSSRSGQGAAKPERRSYNNYPSQMQQQQQQSQQSQHGQQQSHGQQRHSQQANQQQQGWYGFNNQGSGGFGSSSGHGGGNFGWGS